MSPPQPGADVGADVDRGALEAHRPAEAEGGDDAEGAGHEARVPGRRVAGVVERRRGTRRRWTGDTPPPIHRSTTGGDDQAQRGAPATIPQRQLVDPLLEADDDGLEQATPTPVATPTTAARGRPASSVGPGCSAPGGDRRPALVPQRAYLRSPIRASTRRRRARRPPPPTREGLRHLGGARLGQAGRGPSAISARRRPSPRPAHAPSRRREGHATCGRSSCPPTARAALGHHPVDDPGGVRGVHLEADGEVAGARTRPSATRTSALNCTRVTSSPSTAIDRAAMPTRARVAAMAPSTATTASLRHRTLCHSAKSSGPHPLPVPATRPGFLPPSYLRGAGLLPVVSTMWFAMGHRS